MSEKNPYMWTYKKVAMLLHVFVGATIQVEVFGSKQETMKMRRAKPKPTKMEAENETQNQEKGKKRKEKKGKHHLAKNMLHKNHSTTSGKNA